MIADAHIHLFRNGYTGFAGASPLAGQTDVDAYERLMASSGVDRALVVCYEEEIDPGNNGFVRELAASRPWISSVAHLSNSASPSASRAAELLAAGHSGISLHLPDAAAVERVEAWPAAFWDRLDHARAIVSLNARPGAIARLQPLVERTPNCAFLFAHLGLPGRVDGILSPHQATERLAPLLKLAHLANVAVKLSGLYAVDPAPPHRTAAPVVDVLLERFPASRLHWGSDFSPVLDFAGLDQTLAVPGLAGLSAANRRLILGDALAARLAAVRPDH
ncbi:MAG: amidohydrolase family protein [Devosia sp.]|uniref:amidohydrolase family protein n=1 Tax=Devosia sp. TaxID=1871048 RepID=UPI001A413C34|nr:amidohydrolase family protein [Devosia sp.]MBL8597953.1 amidohydrolase family protein [Devosia sp.]